MLTGIERDKAIEHYIKALNKGVLKVMSKMGISDAAELLRRADLRGDRPEPGVHRQVLHAHDLAHRRRRHRRHRRGSAAAPRARVRPAAGAAAGARGGRRVPVAARRRIPPVQPGHGLQAAARDAQRPVHDLQGYTRAVDEQNEHRATLRGLFRFKPAGPPVPLDEVEPVDAIVRRFATGAMSYGSISAGGARDAGHRDEPPGRQVEHRRGRRGSGALHPAGQRRLEAQRDQAGRLRPVRRDQRVPGQRRRAADQDGAGRQAGRGRPASRAQGLSVDRQDAALDAGRRPDFAAAASRHLFDRGSGAADLRLEELESARRGSR